MHVNTTARPRNECECQEKKLRVEGWASKIVHVFEGGSVIFYKHGTFSLAIIIDNSLMLLY